MPVEIERKYLVVNNDWCVPGSGIVYRQGYLSTEPARSVRIRIAGDSAWITVKGNSSGASRAEYEYTIPVSDAAEMLDKLCLSPLIEKTRYCVEYAGLTWEIDDFSGDNAGLVIAEVELDSEQQTFELPRWIGREVTDDARYYNASLVSRPYRDWSGDD